MSFFNKSELQSSVILEGVTLSAISSGNTMMTFFDFEPGAVIPAHKHSNEQITYVIEGSIEFTLENHTRTLNAGDGVVIRPDQEHSARVLFEPAKAVDAWHPLREDYLSTLKEQSEHS